MATTFKPTVPPTLAKLSLDELRQQREEFLATYRGVTAKHAVELRKSILEQYDFAIAQRTA